LSFDRQRNVWNYFVWALSQFLLKVKEMPEIILCELYPSFCWKSKKYLKLSCVSFIPVSVESQRNIWNYLVWALSQFLLKIKEISEIILCEHYPSFRWKSKKCLKLSCVSFIPVSVENQRNFWNYFVWALTQFS
jgi:hypothetical protein